MLLSYIDIEKHYEQLSCAEQLTYLERLFRVSRLDVKFKFPIWLQDYTRFDIIMELPIEVVEKNIVSHLKVNMLLKCRLVNHYWKNLIDKCRLVWSPFLKRYCIDPDGFQDFSNLCFITPKVQDLKKIGEKIFHVGNLKLIDGKTPDLTTEHRPCTNPFILGCKLLNKLDALGRFHIISTGVDGESAMQTQFTVNNQIIAYALDNRFVVVKNTDPPHATIITFEAHQCSSMKIHDELLITAGYDRTIKVWKWNDGSLVKCFKGLINTVECMDIAGDILLSSGRKSITSWRFSTQSMLVKTVCVADDENNIKEIKVVASRSILLVRLMYGLIKVWLCHNNGEITFLSNLQTPESQAPLFTAYLHTSRDTIACSTQFAVHVWSLLDFSFIKTITFSKVQSLHSFQFNSSEENSIILLAYFNNIICTYDKTSRCFRLSSINKKCTNPIIQSSTRHLGSSFGSTILDSACLVENFDNGLRMNTKIQFFLVTRTEIHCSVFKGCTYSYDDFYGCLYDDGFD